MTRIYNGAMWMVAVASVSAASGAMAELLRAAVSALV